MSLGPGKTLLHYEIVERIGEGGMGVVWRARDTTLGRDVAIKVLPEAFATDADRLARFEREAKLLASLNHRSIASIYGLHEADGTRFLAMELVEGEDLAVRLSRGAIPLDEALPLAQQVADALEAAHEQGVIHRDLKPANVVVTPDGMVKVLDFGLAKAFEPDPSQSAASPTMSPTLTSAGTVAGVILGTAAYMAPEQARGHQVDKRADIWAFGALLYEMLTGRKAFDGETVSDTLASVLKVDPDLSALPGKTPEAIRRLLGRCMEKDRKRRLRDIGEARIRVDETLSGVDPDATLVDGVPAFGMDSRGRRSFPWVAALLLPLVLAGGLAIGWLVKPNAPEVPTRRFVIGESESPNPYSGPAISPDGRYVAFEREEKLFLRDLSQFESRAIEGTEGGRKAFWSPDGASIAFGAKGQLWKIALDEGVPVRIADVESFLDGKWREDGTIVLAEGRNLQTVSARGGDLVTSAVAETDEVIDIHGVDVLPGTEDYVVALHHRDNSCSIALWRGDERRTLVTVEDGNLFQPRFVDRGLILYARLQTSEGLWALPFDATSGEATGDPFLVTADAGAYAVSGEGTLAYSPAGGGTGSVELIWVESDGTPRQIVGQPQDEMFGPALSPDRSKVLVSAVESNEFDIWIHDVARGSKTRLTFEDGPEGPGRWSRDGREVYFAHPAFGSAGEIYRVPADGSAEPERLLQGTLPSLSPDDAFVAFVREGKETGSDLWTASISAPEEAKVFLATDADESWPVFSPDGAWIAYVSDESGNDQVYVKSFPSGSGKWQVSVSGGNTPSWSLEGDALFFLQDGVLFRVSASSSGSGLSLGTPEKLLNSGPPTGLRIFGGFSPATDGEGFIFARNVEREGDDEPRNTVSVVQNWLAELDE